MQEGPLLISRGGTYTGTWQSDDPETPAVTIQTAEPVVIENSLIRSRGDLIRTAVDHTDVTIRNTRGQGMNPNAAGRAAGRFFSADASDSVLIENNELSATSGIVIDGFAGDGTAARTIKVLRNRARNIDGRRSDGHGGYLNFNTRRPRSGGPPQDGFAEVQFFQIGHVHHLPGIEIAWNEIINEPGKSRVEDNISIFLSSGTPQSPIRIHDNWVQGAFAIEPQRISDSDERWWYDWSYSGGGIMLGDGSAATLAEACGFVEAFDNQVVGTSNYGIAITAGHDNLIRHNRVISCGRLPDGRPIAAQNVGIAIWDGYHDARHAPPTFFGNAATGNLIGWIKAGTRNDWWHPDAAAWSGNQPWEGEVTPATESAERELWTEKLRAAQVVIGPR